MATASKTHAPTTRRPSWRSRKVWIPIVGIGVLLVGGYIATAQMGLGF